MYIRTMIVLAVLMFPALASGASPKKMCDNAIAPVVQSAVGKECAAAVAQVAAGCLEATAVMMAMEIELSPIITSVCVDVDVTIAGGCRGGVYPQSSAEPDMNSLCAAFPE